MLCLKRNLLLFLFCLFLSGIQVYSQVYSLSGKVVSLPDSTPLQGAVIKINGSTYNSTTNKNGQFTLHNLTKGNHTLTISFIGYSNYEKEITLNENTILPDIGMQLSPFNLDETVVTGTRSEKTLKSVPVLTQVITSRQINESGLISVEKVIETQVPGIDFARLNSLTNVTMQGMDAKYILFLVDGERMAGELSGNIDYSRLNSGNIERIEVVKGASSALYGSQAIGGVINIITKKNTLPFEMNLQSRYSKNNQLNVNANIGVVNGRLSSKTFLFHNSSDGYNLSTDPLQRLYPTQEQFSNYSVGQSFNYSVTDKLLVAVNGSFYRNERFDAARVQTHRYPKYNDYNYGLKSTYFVSDKTSFEFYFNSDKYNSYLVRTLMNNDSLLQNDRLNVLRGLANFSLARKHSFILGSEILQEKIFSERVSGKNKEAFDYNVFGEDEISVNSKININAGLRLNKHTGSDIYLTPSISAIYKLKSWNFRSSYGAGYRTPSLKDLYINFYHSSEPSFVLLGNPNLKPERSNYISASAEYTSSFINVNTELFSNSVRNMMGNKYISASNDTITYVNINRGMVSGINFLAKSKIGPFMAFGGYSYIHSKDKETGNKLYGTVENSGNFGIEYRYSKKIYNLSIMLQDRISGSKYYGVIGHIDDPGFHQWRFAVNQKYKSQYSLVLGIENLFDYINKGSYNCINPGRTFFVQFKLDIKKFTEGIK